MIQKFKLFLIIFLISAGLIERGFSQTNINILPDVNIEVGEEVYFDAVYYSNIFGDSIQCEWDFGDGYTLYADIDGNPFNTGLCAIHYFMSPGDFKVNLTVSLFDMSTSPPTREILLAEDSVTITVTGTSPAAGFELLHAPFHIRTAQYIYAVIPESYDPSQVTIRIERTGGGYSEELTGTEEDDMQKFLLVNADLPSGDYVLTAELIDGETTVRTIREKFSKPYDGAPEVGIDENNAFILNGNTLFFPIAPYMLNVPNIPLWHHVSNTLHTEGWYETHNSSTWIDYISQGNTHGMMAIGPSRWEGFLSSPYTRNSNPNALVIYVEGAKDSPGLLGWNWDDEPNMGGRYLRVPEYVLASWNYRTQQADLQHPTSQQYYGFDYFPRYNPLTGDNGYDYIRSANSFGGKKHFLGDFITHDAYPIEYKEHVSLDYSDRGVIDLWLENLDNFTWNSGGLIPLGTFVETQNITSYQRMSGTSYLTDWDAGPTPGDIRTQMWGAVVHGMKFVGYFQFFTPTPADNMSAMAEFKEAVTALTPEILSEPSSRVITHNATVRGNRVDIMVRENDSDVYVFAVRISEPESEWNEVYEPETIDFQLNTDLSSSIAYNELEKYRWNYMLIDASEGQTEFNFTVPEGSIEPGNFIVSAVINPVESGNPDSLYDRWTGKGYPTALDMQGNLKYGYDDSVGNVTALYSWEGVTGTVNYETGEVYLSYDEGIPAGRGFVQVAYAPGNRVERLISGSDGVFTDILPRNAVRIYRIPKDGSGVDKNKFLLQPNYPNPFNTTTTINYSVTQAGNIKLVIYDLLGREIKILVDEYQSAGPQSAEWDGTNTEGEKVSSGTYFYQIRGEDGDASAMKMILLK
jgi:hypothetical protein